MGFREMYKRMLEKMTFYMIFHKITHNLIWFQMKILRKMISVENPCGKNVPKFQVHFFCRYEVINHRECAFLPFFKHLFCVFHWVRNFVVIGGIKESLRDEGPSILTVLLEIYLTCPPSKLFCLFFGQTKINQLPTQ